jgi:hypothetical protein
MACARDILYDSETVLRLIDHQLLELYEGLRDGIGDTWRCAPVCAEQHEHRGLAASLTEPRPLRFPAP